MPATSLPLEAAVRAVCARGVVAICMSIHDERMSMRRSAYDRGAYDPRSALDDAPMTTARARAGAAAARAALRGPHLLRRARLARELRPALAARLRREPRRRLADRDRELPLDRRRADRRRPPARARRRVEGAVGRPRARRRRLRPRRVVGTLAARDPARRRRRRASVAASPRTRRSR